MKKKQYPKMLAKSMKVEIPSTVTTPVVCRCLNCDTVLESMLQWDRIDGHRGLFINITPCKKCDNEDI
jgi:hypothetical protein